MGSIVSPSAKSIPALKAAALAMKLVDKDIRRDIAQATRSTIGPMWGQALAAQVQTNMDALILFEGAKVTPGNPAKVVAGGSRKALGDGLVPVEHSRAWEFGAPSRIPHEGTYTRDNESTGGSHQVTRHTMRQVPKATRTGRVVYPAWASIAPRIVSLWVQIIVRKIHEALEK